MEHMVVGLMMDIGWIEMTWLEMVDCGGLGAGDIDNLANLATISSISGQIPPSPLIGVSVIYY